ncbi:MAG: hypothetical protein H8F28_26555 [Fibrella sp.]|nr:hypothetical protein [Armatimonadota bacterium]
MNRRAVLATTASLCLLCVTGGYAAVRHLYNPFADLDAGNRTTWSIKENNFRGQVRFYSEKGTFQGSVASDGYIGSPVVATVKVGEEIFVVSGVGRHTLRSKTTGKIAGSVELVAESGAEREALWQRHDRENGIEQRLSINHGAKGGYGKCVGFFGDAPNRLTWELAGSNVRVLFFDSKTGKQVYSGTAGPVNDTIRAELKQTLSPESYAASVANHVPSDPRFSWQTPDGKWRAFMTFRSFPMTLPDGTELRVELAPGPP